MNYYDFCTEVRQRLSETLPDDSYIRIHGLPENGTLPSEGCLSVTAADGSGTQCFSLPEFYAQLRRGVSPENIASQIRRKYLCEGALRLSALFREGPPEKLREQIVFRLIGKASRRAYLAELPHRDFLDLAVIYELRREYGGRYLGTIPLTEEAAGQLGLSEPELYELALSNTPQRLPAVCSPLTELLRRTEEELSGAYFCRAQPFPVPAADSASFVLTNAHCFAGTAVLLYPGFREMLHGRFGDFLLLPCSIHEWLLIPDLICPDRKQLKAAVKEINRSMLDLSEVLSDSVYFFRRDGEAEVL